MSSITLLLDESDAANVEHWESVARAAAVVIPRIDVTKAGVMRAAIIYGLCAADSMATRAGMSRARSYLADGPWHPGVTFHPQGRAHLSPIRLILPNDLSGRLLTRGRELLQSPNGGLGAIAAIFLHLGLHELHLERPEEVSEFLLQHFETEAGAGLRRGRPRRAVAA
jgi:hypothetical protein